MARTKGGLRNDGADDVPVPTKQNKRGKQQQRTLDLTSEIKAGQSFKLPQRGAVKAGKGAAKVQQRTVVKAGKWRPSSSGSGSSSRHHDAAPSDGDDGGSIGTTDEDERSVVSDGDGNGDHGAAPSDGDDGGSCDTDEDESVSEDAVTPGGNAVDADEDMSLQVEIGQVLRRGGKKIQTRRKTSRKQRVDKDSGMYRLMSFCCCVLITSFCCFRC